MTYNNKFRIVQDGDSFEKIGWNLFVEKKFPNYDVFWANFIAPNTRCPVDIWFKDNTPNDVRVISMLHYGIFMHFLFIYKNFNNSDDIELFRYSYIKLSSIIDLTEEFLIKFLLYIKKIEPNELIVLFENKKFNLTHREILKQFNRKSSLSIPVISRLNLIKKIYNFNQILLFEKYSTEIKSYRNILIHSWPLFQISPNKVPKKETVNNIDFRDWTKIINKLNDPQEKNILINKDFIDMNKLITEDTDIIIKCINSIWEQVTIDLNTFITK
jgi:hypothetical protein